MVPVSLTTIFRFTNSRVENYEFETCGMWIHTSTIVNLALYLLFFDKLTWEISDDDLISNITLKKNYVNTKR